VRSVRLAPVLGQTRSVARPLPALSAVSALSTASAVKSSHCSLSLPADGFLFQIVALVDGRFAFAESKLDFDPPVFPIHPKRDQCLALDCTGRKEFGNFPFV
jgi:hypothetical protein